MPVSFEIYELSPLCHRVCKYVSETARDLSEAFGEISRGEAEGTSIFARVLLINFHLQNAIVNKKKTTAAILK